MRSSWDHLEREVTPPNNQTVDQWPRIAKSSCIQSRITNKVSVICIRNQVMLTAPPEKKLSFQERLNMNVILAEFSFSLILICWMHTQWDNSVKIVLPVWVRSIKFRRWMDIGAHWQSVRACTSNVPIGWSNKELTEILVGHFSVLILHAMLSLDNTVQTV
jgi:hypothetical protein